MSAPEIKTSILQIHATTIPHLSFVEKIVFDELEKQGRAQIINNAPRNRGESFE